MAQTAMAIPGYVAGTPKEIAISGFKLPEINWPKFDALKFDKEAFEFGEIDKTTIRAKFDTLKAKGADLFSGAKKEKTLTPTLKPKITTVPKLRGFSKVTNTSKVTPIAIKLKNWTADKLSTLKASWNEHELSSSVKAAQAKAAPIGDMLKDKLGLDPSVNSNALATLVMALLAALFLILGLALPSRKR